MSSPILTSIPPYFSRLDAQGREIGDAYLASCIESWRACGFDPVTVNSVNEDLHPIIGDLNLRILRVPRDARALTGRAHVFLADLLKAALEFDQERVFIINADIELEMAEAAKERIHGMKATDAFVAHRLDHAGNKATLNQTYRGGIDVIGAGHDMLEGLNCGNLVFGMPWWDHYLPLMLMGRDANFVCGHGIKPWHLDHGGRWNKVQHVEFGKEFLRLLRKAAPLLRQNADFISHMGRLEGAFRGAESDTMSRRMKTKLLAATFPNSKAYYRRVLREASRLDESIFANITAGSDT